MNRPSAACEVCFAAEDASAVDGSGFAVDDASAVAAADASGFAAAETFAACAFAASAFIWTAIHDWNRDSSASMSARTSPRVFGAPTFSFRSFRSADHRLR